MWKNKKNIINLLSAKLAHGVVKVKTNDQVTKAFSYRGCVLSVVCPYPGAVYMYKIMEIKTHKIRVQSVFLFFFSTS